MQNTLADITFKMHRSTLCLAAMSLLNINSSHITDITFKMHRSTLRLAAMSLLNINSSHVLSNVRNIQKSPVCSCLLNS